MVANVVLIVGGLVVLGKGADVFVLAAARVARALHLSPVLVGAVVVGFGTGAPELLVSSVAAGRGSIDLAAGNVVGSNLANLTLVLGVGGLLARPESLPRVVRREAPLSLATVVLFAALLQGGLTRRDGAVALAALVVAVAVMVRGARARPPAAPAPSPADDAAREEYVHEVVEFVEQGEAAPRLRPEVVRLLGGLLATVAGAQLLVVGAQRAADDLGLSGGFVGLTVVAIGTSLPELVTAVQAARRNETALIAGNVLGSNVFNCTAVAGAAALVGPGAIDDPSLTVVAALSMVIVAALTWLFLATSGRLQRWEAGLLLAVYLATLPLTS